MSCIKILWCLCWQVHGSGFGVQEEGMPAAQRVLLGEVPAAAVLALLQFLYTAQCPLTPSLAPHIQELASRFVITGECPSCSACTLITLCSSVWLPGLFTLSPFYPWCDGGELNTWNQNQETTNKSIYLFIDPTTENWEMTARSISDECNHSQKPSYVRHPRTHPQGFRCLGTWIGLSS